MFEKIEYSVHPQSHMVTWQLSNSGLVTKKKNIWGYLSLQFSLGFDDAMYLVLLWRFSALWI